MRNTQNLQLRSIILLVLAIAIGATVPAPTQAQTGSGSTISGWVRDEQTHDPIAGARVELDGQVTMSDAQGQIATNVEFDGPTTSITVRVTAPGYAPWRFEGVELRSDQPVTLEIELGDQPTIIAPERSLDGDATLPEPPEYIRVARTFNTNCVYPPPVQRVDRMLFKDYVRNVLPNEWVASWPAAALDAGAVAVSQYAWSAGFAQRKWTARGYNFDVVDSTCDQVYKDRDPQRNYSATDAAVNRMLGTALLRNGTLITTFYRAKDEQCGSSLDCMGQWGSYYRAQAGESGLQILRTYYGRKAPVADVPPYAARLLQRSQDVTIAPGTRQTVSVQMCNGGTYRWRQNVALRVIDPTGTGAASIESPFEDATWPDPQQPAIVSEADVAWNQRGSWQFTINAPVDLAPGSYQLAVTPTRDDGTPITLDQPIVWNITVATAQPTSADLPQRLWLPMIEGATATAASCG